jgi:uncharacterized repeat protein (TIGR01451 family)
MVRSVPHRRPPLATFALLVCLCALLSGCATTRPVDPFAAQQAAAAQPVTVAQPIALQPGTALVPAGSLAGISVFPGRLVAPIGNEVLVVATVNTPGKPQAPYQRVEWILAPQGVGSFLGTGESDRPFFASGTNPEKLDNGYLISETASVGHVLQRGTATTADDVTILPGQAWLTMTSPTEGVSYVTAFAPDLNGVYGNRQTAAIHWVDARWTLPPQINARVGANAPIAVTVYRQSSGAPVANWRVRYSISGGPPGNFSAGGTQTFEATTDAAGQAVADLTQAVPQPGINTLTVELVRPENSAPGVTEPLIVGTASTQVTWSETGPVTPAPTTPGGTIPLNPVPGQNPVPPATVPGTPQPGTNPPAASPVKLNLLGPTTAATGQEVKFQLELTNTSNAPLNTATLNVEFDPGLENKLGASPIKREMTDPIPPGRSLLLNLPFMATRPGQQCINVTVTTLTGAPAQARSCLNVVGATPGIGNPPRVSLKVTPTARQAPLGSEQRVIIEVENAGNEPLNDLTIETAFSPELTMIAASPEYSVPAYGLKINRPAGTISFSGFKVAPNGRLTPPLEIGFKSVNLTPPNKPALIRVNALANGQPFTQDTTIEVTPPQAAAPTAGSKTQMEFSKSEVGQQIKVGNRYRYSIVVNNIGSAADRNVQLTVKLPDQVQIVPNGINVQPANVTGQVITFPPIDEVKPNARPLPYLIEVTAAQPGDGAFEATLTSQGQPQPQKISDPVRFYTN